MPDISAAYPDLQTLQPAELQNRRAELVRRMNTEFKGYDDPTIPTELLNELLEMTRILRRKTAGPPKAAKAKSGAKASKVDATDLMDGL